MRVLLAFLLGATGAAAANFYCGPTASGNGNGSAWNNMANFATLNLARGNTYYLADGSYGRKSFNVADSGTTQILVQKATVASHGSATGWADNLGDGTADFAQLDIQSNYFTVDGMVGQWASDLPGYVPYGIRVFANTQGNFDCRIFCGTNAARKHDITVRHVEAYFTNAKGAASQWAPNQDCLNSSSWNLVVQYCWLHNAGRVVLWSQMYPSNENNLLCEYSVLERNGEAANAGVTVSGDPEHSEMVALWGNPGHGGGNGPLGVIIRYNYIRDQLSTGGVMIMGSQGQEVSVYGNVFSSTGYYGAGFNANGILNGLDPGQTVAATLRVYNNTFVDLAYGSIVGNAGDFAVNELKNNIFYSCQNNGGSPLAIGASGASRSSNWYFNSGAQTETNIQNGSGDPFVNRAGRNYRLSAATNPGVNLGSPFNVDMDGVSRATWTRGAFEFAGGKPSPTPTPTPAPTPEPTPAPTATPTPTPVPPTAVRWEDIIGKPATFPPDKHTHPLPGGQTGEN